MRRWSILVVALAAACGGPRAEVSGELKVWHTVTLTFDGPETSETAAPNPFTDYRLDVTFSGPAGEYTVPGFYAADGQAAETSAESGPKWQVRFTPDAEGEWSYLASFRGGPGIAFGVDEGEPTSFDGASGSFTVGPSDKQATDFRSRGRLDYVGERYPRFAGDGAYFLKGGADSPENLLAYEDFDSTRDHDAETGRREAFLHRYEPHLGDWREGDPTWQGAKGKGLIGG